ncbi:MAG: ABC transporter permease subunit [Acetobacteraceae bacterium]|nr:ABC transporter permease subunit [Acetobacteraceae bacterium]
MNWRTALAVCGRDLRDAARNRGALVPAVAVPVVLAVLLPLLIVYLPALTRIPLTTFNWVEIFYRHIPPGVRERLGGLGPEATEFYALAVYFFAPLFLLIPAAASTVAAADSFAGEKERRTLEALYYTPASDAELLWGKTLAALVPGLGAAWFAILAYTGVINAVGWTRYGLLPLPNLAWVLMAGLLLPAAAVFSVALTVVVSAKARTSRGAQQVAGVVVLPAVALLVMQSFGVVYLGWGLVLGLAAVFSGLAWLLLALAARTFRRENAVLYS